MKLRYLVAALALIGGAGAQAQTSVGGFSPSPGLYSSPYTITFASLSGVAGDVTAAGATVAVGVSLSNLSGFYSFDADATDGFAFSNLAAGSYLLQFTAYGTGPGAFGGYYNVSAVPEPETYAMMLAGLSAMGFMAARRRKG